MLNYLTLVLHNISNCLRCQAISLLRDHSSRDTEFSFDSSSVCWDCEDISSYTREFQIQSLRSFPPSHRIIDIASPLPAPHNPRFSRMWRKGEMSKMDGADPKVGGIKVTQPYEMINEVRKRCFGRH
jgi:hypothetical protein